MLVLGSSRLERKKKIAQLRNVFTDKRLAVSVATEACCDREELGIVLRTIFDNMPEPKLSMTIIPGGRLAALGCMKVS